MARSRADNEIGIDEWVAKATERTGRQDRALMLVRSVFGEGPSLAGLAVFGALAALYPLAAPDDYMVRVGINVLLLALLTLGLNITFGWAGVLDLGFVAFYGLGAYTYAFLSSNQFGIHLPTVMTLAIVTISAAIMALILGLPSFRLVGDYLAILTLFFAQIFVELGNNLDRLTPPWSDSTLDITGGPDGIVELDPFRFLGVEFTGMFHYYYLLTALVILAVIGLRNLNRSRTGRGWRSLREDFIAAEHMTMPVKRLRLTAYIFGAVSASIAGSVFAAVQTGVFPINFEVTFLIVIYTALVLGGSGSIAGAIVGAIVIGTVPEVLRSPTPARWLFYGALAIGLLAKVRPWPRLASVVAGVLGFSWIVRAILTSLWADSIAVRSDAGFLNDLVSRWVVVLTENQLVIGNLAFVLMLAAILLISMLRSWPQIVILIPTLYLAAFVWENRLVDNPSITRQLLFGATLVVMMTIRPHGLLGKPRVERW